MPLIQIEDEAKLKRAYGILIYEVRGTFHIYPNGKLFIGNRQFQALKAAGLVRESDARGDDTRRRSKS